MVGGAVRDALLGLAVQDRDWVIVGATPKILQSAGFLPVGKDFPVFLHPSTREEVALARQERGGGRRAGRRPPGRPKGARRACDADRSGTQ